MGSFGKYNIEIRESGNRWYLCIDAGRGTEEHGAYIFARHHGEYPLLSNRHFIGRIVDEWDESDAERFYAWAEPRDCSGNFEEILERGFVKWFSHGVVGDAPCPSRPEFYDDSTIPPHETRTEYRKRRAEELQKARERIDAATRKIASKSSNRV